MPLRIIESSDNGSSDNRGSTVYTKNHPKNCVGYSDADWAVDINDRKSTYGYLSK